MTPTDPEGGEDTGVPRWVKVLGAVALLLIVVFVVLQLAGLGGEHGPGRHSLASGPPGITHAAQQP